MEALPIVSVRGHAELEVPPELAQVSVTVAVRGRTRDQAEARLVELSTAIGRQLEPLAAALRRQAASAVWIYPVLRSRRSSTPERFEGRRSWTIEVVDFGVLPGLLGGLAVGEEVTIGGPHWQLAPDSPVFQQARLAAVRDAVTRATAYAQAFGARIERLVEVADTGLLDASPATAPGGPYAMRAMAASAGRGAPAIEELDLSPVDQQVSGSIEARFVMSAPDLTGLVAAD